MQQHILVQDVQIVHFHSITHSWFKPVLQAGLKYTVECWYPRLLASKQKDREGACYKYMLFWLDLMALYGHFTGMMIACVTR
jgi:hypothetical protein